MIIEQLPDLDYINYLPGLVGDIDINPDCRNSFPWFESLKDEPFKAKIERSQAKLRNTTVTTYKDVYWRANYKVSRHVYAAKYQSYSERIAL